MTYAKSCPKQVVSCLTAPIAILLGSLIVPSQANAQFTIQQKYRLVDQLEAAAIKLDSEKITTIDQARQSYDEALFKLHDHLRRTTDPVNAGAWVKYLAVESLSEAIEGLGEKPGRKELKEFFDAAQKVRDRSIGIEPGLELTAVRGVRDAVIKFIPAVRFRNPDATKRFIDKQLVELADDWKEIANVPTPDEAAQLSGILSLLDETNQRDGLFTEATRQFSYPNACITVGESIVQRAISRSVNQSRPVRDCILGTSISGTATMQGQVSASLLPTQGSIRVQVALTGNVFSNNIGRNGPVRLRTTGNASVMSQRIVHVSESGIFAEPVQTEASLSTRINSIEHRLRLVRRIARRKAAETKPLADRIATEKLRAQVSTQFAQETDEALARPIPNPVQELRPWFLRLDMPTPTRSIGSTSNSVYVHATLRRDWQLASPTPAPPVPYGYEAVVQIHESLIDNSIGHVLAGRTVNEDELNKLLKQGGRGNSFERKESDDPFELDFARARPIIFEARNGQIRLGVRGTRFQQGRKGIAKPLEISAYYEPVRTVEGYAILRRVDDTKIDFPGTKRLSVGQAGMRNAMKKKFAGVFPQYLMDQPWAVPPSVESNAVKGRVYRPRQVIIKDGWLTVAVN